LLGKKEEMIEMAENQFQGFRQEFVPLLVERGGRRHVWVQIKEIQEFNSGRRGALGNQESD
jgi:hypothetical protein